VTDTHSAINSDAHIHCSFKDVCSTTAEMWQCLVVQHLSIQQDMVSTVRVKPHDICLSCMRNQSILNYWLLLKLFIKMHLACNFL